MIVTVFSSFRIVKALIIFYLCQTQFMLDMDGVTGLIRTAMRKLNVDPSSYGIQVSRTMLSKDNYNYSLK